MTGLGRAQSFQSNFAGAEKTLLEAVAIEKKVSGDEHQFVAEALIHLARSYADRGDLPKSQATFQQAIGMLEKVFGSNDTVTVQTRAELAAAQKRLGTNTVSQ